MVAAVALIGIEGAGQTLKGDEWAYAGRLAGTPFLQTAFDPGAGKYLIAAPLLVYKLLFELVGIDSATFPTGCLGWRCCSWSQACSTS